MVVGASGQHTTTESRRKAILQAALKSFSTKGFTETTMEDIRRLSGASTGSIYHHFENKEMLAQALYVEGRGDLNAALLASITDRHLREGIKAMVYAYIDWFEQHPDLGQYIMQADSTERFPQNLYVPLVIGPSKEYVRRWLRTRLTAEMQEAREPLAEAAWKVLSPPAP